MISYLLPRSLPFQHFRFLLFPRIFVDAKNADDIDNEMMPRAMISHAWLDSHISTPTVSAARRHDF